MAGYSGRFDLTRKVAVALGRYGWNHPLGGAVGYRLNGTVGEYAFSDWTVRATWLELAWKPVRMVHLGAGPGWYELEDGPHDLHRFGAVLEAGLEPQTEGRWFLDLNARYQLVPTTDVRYTTVSTLILRPRWTHLALTVGAGYRF